MTDKYIQASKLLALQRYAPNVGGDMIYTGQLPEALKWINADDLRALIDEAPEVEPVCFAEQDNIDMSGYDNLSFSYPVSTKSTENRTAPLYVTPPPNTDLATIIAAIESDAHAASFQSMAQYRKWLLDLVKGVGK